ncbi:amidoligase family protein [Balneolaceae bacterium ANBcel3]|nr:amidoligase family protein [Balneolaceae bacterium ANBcel3]
MIQYPPKVNNHEGKPRKMGLEIEFSGLSIDEIVALVKECYGGVTEAESGVKKYVKDSRLGDFTIELDWANLQKLAKEKPIEGLGDELGFPVDPDWQFRIEHILTSAASTVVPYEVSFPAVPFQQIPELEHLRRAILEKKGKGTGASAFNAFGLHLNPEAPSLEASDILRYLQAFLLLYEWLIEAHEINITRKITPFIDAFPDAYVEKVLDPGYKPDHAMLIDDYLTYNPTRNRPLDMLPLFAWIDKKRVRQKLEDELIRSRPTFHYRLPNSSVDDPEWTFTHEWNIWVQVEQLAESDEKRKHLMDLYTEKRDHPGKEMLEKWKRAWNSIMKEKP